MSRNLQTHLLEEQGKKVSGIENGILFVKLIGINLVCILKCLIAVTVANLSRREHLAEVC
jgi:tetrahydromethanopterin S-methyltransferase subunit G